MPFDPSRFKELSGCVNSVKAENGVITISYNDVENGAAEDKIDIDGLNAVVDYWKRGLIMLQSNIENIEALKAAAGIT